MASVQSVASCANPAVTLPVTDGNKVIVQTTTEQSAQRPISYLTGCGLKVLAAEKLGLNPGYLEAAKTAVTGGAMHAMIAAAIEREAVNAHNAIAGDRKLMEKANEVLLGLMREHRLSASDNGGLRGTH